MSRTVRFSEIRKASPEVRDTALAGIIAEAKSPANGTLDDLEARIAGYEEEHGISSDRLLEELSTGAREETSDVVSWLMLLRLKERIGPTSPS